MNPVEVFQYLLEKKLPLIISFPMEEERGHLITGKGLCYVDSVHGTSRITLGRFSPFRLLAFLRTAVICHATFEVRGTTYGCLLKDITFHGEVSEKAHITTSIPDGLSSFPRRFLRVEPSAKSPAVLYVKTMHYGTLQFNIKDISEGGVGFVSPTVLDLEQNFICAIHLPIESDNIVLSGAVLVYTKDQRESQGEPRKDRSNKGIFYGLELFPHQEDGKKIRLYVLERERQIRQIIQRW